MFAYLDGNIDKMLFEQDIVRPLKNADHFDAPYLKELQNKVAYADEIDVVPVKETPEKIACCDIAFYIDGESDAYIFSLRKPSARAISEPPTSSVMKGPREDL